MSIGTILNVHVRVYPVKLKDERSGNTSADTFILTKEQLTAAALLGEDDKTVIRRTYNRAGFKVVDIGTPTKKTVPIDLLELVTMEVDE